MPRRTSPPLPASGAWADELPVREHVLDNGFRTLVLPRRKAPVVVCSLFYPVGSFDEPPGKTGLSHFVEHMLFKGTAQFPKGAIDALSFSAAGQANAETGEDFTHYWFAFPSDRWELALRIEADRMRGARFDPREVEAERKVILEEQARDLDSPQGRLDQTHQAMSYLRHPYRNPILGWPDDIARIDVDDLRGFYRANYRPDGAVLVIAGGVDPDAVFRRIGPHFGDIEAWQRPRPAQAVDEPRQSGRRDFVLREPEKVVRGVLGWHTVSRGHPDAPALEVLADILACGRRSRLWDALVEGHKVATYIDAAQASARRAGQFVVQMEAPAGADPAVLERRLSEVVARLADDGPTPEELARSRHRLEAAWRWEREDLAGLAAGLGQVALCGDWRAWQVEHRAEMAVDAEAIRRVAATYLVESGLTVGWSRPRRDRERGVAESPAIVSFAGPAPRQGPHAEPASPTGIDLPEARVPIPLTVPPGISRLRDFRPRRSALPNGLRLIHERRPDTGVVALELYVDAGILREAKPGLACLTGRLLEEGTAKRSAAALAEAIEDVGGAMDVGPTGISLRVREEDLPLALEVMAEMATAPAFSEDALDWTRRRIVSEIEGDSDDPSYRADLLFRGLIYGTHPLGRDPRGGARDLAKLSGADVRAHHARHFVPDDAFLVAVGDFDVRRLSRLVKTHLGGWAPRGSAAPPADRDIKPLRPRARRIYQPGEQVQILLGHLGIARNHPDHDALLVLDHIFGSGPGFSDRLSRIVRDEMGLVYSIGGSIADSADLAPGMFRVAAAAMPDSADRVIAAVLEQIRAMHAGEFSDDEVERSRHYLAGSWVFDFQTVEQRAERLFELERWGLELDEPIAWPERIARISPQQVRTAARVHLLPDALCRVELGPIRRPGHRSRAECA